MISGTVKDARTGETLPNANIISLDPATGGMIGGTTSDLQGKFSLEGKLYGKVTASYTGYQSASATTLTKDQTINFNLAPAVIGLKEVEITATDPVKQRRRWIIAAGLILAAAAAYWFYKRKK